MSWKADTDPVKGAKNIRVELKGAFPGIKFSVRAHRHGYGGSCTDITVSTSEKVDKNAVESIIEKYAAHTGWGFSGEKVKTDLTFQNKYGSGHHVYFHNY